MIRVYSLIPQLLARFCLWGALLLAFPSYGQDASELFAQYQQQIFQLQLIDRQANSKAAIGSGFQVSNQGLLVSNYHVVSDLVLHPERFSLELVLQNGGTESLRVEAVDVINDLALLKRQNPGQSYLELASGLPKQGETVFSIGNPRDLGMTVVEGTFNGLLSHSFYQRILFSGSINPGMSGGPALDHKGQVVGVNVATSGNQLSYLVPVDRVHELMKRAEMAVPVPLLSSIQQQLSDNQQQLMQRVLQSDWPKAELGQLVIPGELADLYRCWGGSDNEDDSRYSLLYTRCFNNDSIYLSHDFSTGKLSYEFYWLQSKDLNRWQFFNRYQRSFMGAAAINRASDKHVEAFRCHDDFVLPAIAKSAQTKPGQSSSGDTSDWKMVMCVRPYKRFNGLYDVLLMAATIDHDDRGLVAHFSLAGVSSEQARAFARRFMERIQWKS